MWCLRCLVLELNFPPLGLVFARAVLFCTLKLQFLGYKIGTKLFDIGLVFSNLSSIGGASLGVAVHRQVPARKTETVKDLSLPLPTRATPTHSLLLLFRPSRPTQRAPASTPQLVCWICSFRFYVWLSV